MNKITPLDRQPDLADWITKCMGSFKSHLENSVVFINKDKKGEALEETYEWFLRGAIARMRELFSSDITEDDLATIIKTLPERINRKLAEKIRSRFAQITPALIELIQQTPDIENSILMYCFAEAQYILLSGATGPFIDRRIETLKAGLLKKCSADPAKQRIQHDHIIRAIDAAKQYIEHEDITDTKIITILFHRFAAAAAEHFGSLTAGLEDREKLIAFYNTKLGEFQHLFDGHLREKLTNGTEKIWGRLKQTRAHGQMPDDVIEALALIYYFETETLAAHFEDRTPSFINEIVVSINGRTPKPDSEQ